MFRLSCVFLLFVLNASGTMVQSPNMAETFRQCLISQSGGSIGTCLAMGTINKLQSLDSHPEFDIIDGVTLTKDSTQEFREGFSFADAVPASFRSIVDSFNYVFSRRNTHLNMDFLYPGMVLQMVPSAQSGGQLEFVLDPHQESLNAHSLKESGTGTIIARQFVVPFLLGLKFNVVSIIPILFGLLALLAKKALIISKIALIASSAVGLGSLLFTGGNKLQQNQYQYHYQQPLNPGFGGGYKGYPEDDYQNIAYRGLQNTLPDQLKLQYNLNDAYDVKEKGKGRNFAWNEHEKVGKILPTSRK